MSATSVITETPQQMLDLSRSVMRLSWAATVFGAQQAFNAVNPSKMADSGKTLASACDAVSHAIEAQFGSGFESAYRMGSAFAVAPLYGLGSSELNRAMQEFAMQPVIFTPMKVMLPPLVGSMTAFVPGRDAGLAREECEAKMGVMQLVQDVRSILPDKNVRVPLKDIVAKAYGLGTFAALWAIEGVGHDVIEGRRHRGDSLTDWLAANETAGLPDGSLTMLHAGAGLGLAELALDDLTTDSSPEAIDVALRAFLDRVKTGSRSGYAGCALESLGLVTQHFYGHSMVKLIDKRLEGIDAALRAFFWHGVGRAIYFSPENMIPITTAWPAVKMVDRLATHDVARDNMRSGLAWGMTMVNLRQPKVLEGFLKEHGAGFADSEAFINGIMSSMIMRKDTTPDEPHIAAFRAYEPASSDPTVQALWEKVVRQPLGKALDEHYPVLKKKGRLGEIFRFQNLAALAS